MGMPEIEVRPIFNDNERKICLRIRKKVFIEGQGISRKDERDGLDYKSEVEHFIVLMEARPKRPVGCARIVYMNEMQTAKLERIAILNAYRGRGYGKELTKHLIDRCQHNSVSKIFMNAQYHLKGMYAKLGFVEIGEPFTEAGIKHIRMVFKNRNPNQLFVPDNFQIPISFETDRIRLRMLTVNDVVKDYDAVMTSIDYLQQIKPFGPDHNWPASDLTFEQDLIDLGWHQKEFQRRTSFAYTVMDLDEVKCLGCVYIYPSPNIQFDAMIMMWTRQSEIANGLDKYLFSAIKHWIKKDWPFLNPAYPGVEFD